MLPLIHVRAVRLATRRLEAEIPVSLAEIRADRDLLRAEFAISARRLEMRIQQLKTKMAGQLAELGRKTDEVNRLKVELGEKTIFPLEARQRAHGNEHQPNDELQNEPSLIGRLAQVAKLNPDLDKSRW